uniref:Protein LLP homolog n=1 Tax=Timema genevievae TaxID=629358 RepID=A0A7R9PP18_TIMGE|nr:unnamed protein product [Timema genevievae]
MMTTIEIKYRNELGARLQNIYWSRRKSIFTGSVPTFAWRESGKPFRGEKLNTPDRDLNLDLPVVGSLVYCESSALDHAATEEEMAKSLRSKWRRKMRAIKRERYAVKELAKLKKMLGIDDTTTDVEMKENVIEFTLDSADKKDEAPSTPQETTEVPDLEEEKKQETKSLLNMKNKHGTYPVWLSQRKVRALAKSRKQKKTLKHKKSMKQKNRKIGKKK